MLVHDDFRYEAVPNVDHYTMQADRVAQAVLLGSPLRYDAQDPVRGAAALEACVQSFQTHERVEVARRLPAQGDGYITAGDNPAATIDSG